MKVLVTRLLTLILISALLAISTSAQQKTIQKEPIRLTNRCSTCLKHFLDLVVTSEANKDQLSKVIIIGYKQKSRKSKSLIQRYLKFFKGYLSNVQKLESRVLVAQTEIIEKAGINTDKTNDLEVGFIEFYIKGELIGVMSLKEVKAESDENEDCATDVPCFRIASLKNAPF